MKFGCIFVVFNANEQTYKTLQLAVFLYPNVSCVSQRYKPLVSLTELLIAMVAVLFVGANGKSSGFLYIYNSNFIVKMPTNNEIRVRANSTSNSTPDSAKTVPYSEYQTELNAKNKAYHFLLSRNLLEEFAEFCERYCLSDPHEGCLALLLSKKSNSHEHE